MTKNSPENKNQSKEDPTYKRVMKEIFRPIQNFKYNAKIKSGGAIAIGSVVIFVLLILGQIFEIFDVLRAIYNIISTIVSAIAEFSNFISFSPWWTKFILLIATAAWLFFGSYGIWRTQKNQTKIALLSSLGAPFLIICLLIFPGLGSNEVAFQNVGVIFDEDDESSSSVISYIRQNQSESNAVEYTNIDIDVYPFMQTENYSLDLIRNFVFQNNIKYLVVSSGLNGRQVAEIRSALNIYSVVVLTYPIDEINPQDVIGLYISPEAEADHIARALTSRNTATNVVLIYDDSSPAEGSGDFSRRLRSELIVRLGASLRGLVSYENYIRSIRSGYESIDAFVVVADPSESLAIAAALRAQFAGARIITSGRILDSASLDDIDRYELEVPIPWPVARSLRLQHDLDSTARPAGIGREVAHDIETIAAATFLVRAEEVLHSVRLNELRSRLFADSEIIGRSTRDVFGQAYLEDGTIPHLRAGELELYASE